MRRQLFVVIVLAGACNHAKPSGPAWPQMAKTEPEEDGGESIAPRTSIAAVVEKSAEPEDKKADPEGAKPDAPAAAKAADETPAAAPTAPSTDDVINTEEIIIEIDGDD
jgi:hypothetical protein